MTTPTFNFSSNELKDFKAIPAGETAFESIGKSNNKAQQREVEHGEEGHDELNQNNNNINSNSADTDNKDVNDQASDDDLDNADDDKFVQAAFQIFLDLNQQLQSTSGLDTIMTTANSFGEIQPHPTGPSRQQHATLVNQSLLSFLGLLETRINEASPGSSTQDSLINNFHIIKCLVALYFSSTLHRPTQSERTHHLLLPILEWVNIMDPRPTLDDTTDIMECNPAAGHPYFWPYIYTLACRGLFKQCSNSLSYSGLFPNCSETQRVLTLARRLLDSYPLENLTSFAFRQWHASTIVAQEVLTLESPNMDPATKLSLKTLFEILKGNSNIIASNTTTWPEALAARLLFNDPTDASIGDHYKWAESVHSEDITDSVIVACGYLLQGRILDAIRLCKGNSKHAGSQLVAAYMANYCDLRGLLDTYNINGQRSGSAVRDWLIIDHAKSCLQKETLAPIGIYLLEYIITESDEPSMDQSVQECRDLIAAYLPTHPFSSVDALTWALTICERLDLTTTQIAIYESRAHQYVRDRHFLDAIVTFERAGQMNQVRHYSWLLFETALVLGQPSLDPLLHQVVNHRANCTMVISSKVADCLAPYAVLSQFLTSISQGALSDPQAILALLAFPYMEKKYIPLLVCHAVSSLAKMDLSGLAALVAALDNNETDKKGLELVSRASLVDRAKLNKGDWRLDTRLELANGARRVLLQVRGLIAKAVASTYLSSV
ncbi:hypothetical protein NADFUDRAFT_81877 [Nadsonia fulvescens var. elongata DSM 6958]|uniref:Nuclear pore complex protein Nup85 n=1 Tax=Nadsonia fulvescens var. elongata DSM 6958 TaxID=857566 RepID=A0A1E3PPN5_9ASCO|nr:hypothetical protein NADFUDRAFT_81877 [Nadsonia fulvescens var. elongata DSM 6958]